MLKAYPGLVDDDVELDCGINVGSLLGEFDNMVLGSNEGSKEGCRLGSNVCLVVVGVTEGSKVGLNVRSEANFGINDCTKDGSND